MPQPCGKYNQVATLQLNLGFILLRLASNTDHSEAGVAHRRHWKAWIFQVEIAASGLLGFPWLIAHINIEYRCPKVAGMTVQMIESTIDFITCITNVVWSGNVIVYKLWKS